MKDSLQINVTKADSGQLIARYQGMQGAKVVYERIDVYPNVNSLCRGLKKVFGALEVAESASANVEDEIARIRKQIKDLEDNTGDKKDS